MKLVHYLAALVIALILALSGCAAPTDGGSQVGTSTAALAVGYGPGAPVQLFLRMGAPNTGKPFEGRTVIAIVNAVHEDDSADLMYSDPDEDHLDGGAAGPIFLTNVPIMPRVMIDGAKAACPGVDPGVLESAMFDYVVSHDWQDACFQFHNIGSF